jgi:hypothetical protein
MLLSYQTRYILSDPALELHKFSRVFKDGGVLSAPAFVRADKTGQKVKNGAVRLLCRTPADGCQTADFASKRFCAMHKKPFTRLFRVCAKAKIAAQTAR